MSPPPGGWSRSSTAARTSSRADRRPRQAGRALGVTFPDPIFRFVVGKLASDVLDYLYGSWTEAMRAPVRQALLRSPRPKVIVAHSLGTVILYDVLSEPVFAGFKVDLLVTVGSPLGIGNIQRRLRDGAGRPNPVPKPVRIMVQLRRPVRSGRASRRRCATNSSRPRTSPPTRASTTRPATTTTSRAISTVGVVRQTIVDAAG